MPPNLRPLVKGVATMKLSVAFLLVLNIFSLGTIAHGQTTSRRQNKTAVGKPRSETIRVCQGVPIPDGYIIVAYMTSSACPHGAYVVKKQDDYERSLAVIRNLQKSADESAPTVAPSAPPTGISTKATEIAAQPAGGSARRGDASASVSRPRR